MNQSVEFSMENIKTCGDIENVIEILKNQLYFVVLNGCPVRKLKSTSDTLYINIDDELVYQNYYNDFGPLTISCLFKYCCKLNKSLRYCKGFKRVVHYTSSDLEKKTNSAYLMGVYLTIFYGFNPKSVLKTLSAARPYKPFLDASQYRFDFGLRLIDIFQAMTKAFKYNFVNFQDFSDLEYDMYSKLQFGDMNWLLPRKFLAFIGPNVGGELAGHPPGFYLKYFLKNDVKTVIRLNNKTYDEKVFKQAGIEHYDLIYPDGTVPPKQILLKFLDIAETAPMAIAVHCKAGLGRTGSLIGAYIMKHFNFTAREVIAWLRVCRPGCVIGQQQVWLEKVEPWLWRLGQQYRMKKFDSVDKIPCFKYGIYSKIWELERNKLMEGINDSVSKQNADAEKDSKLRKYHKFKKKLTHTAPSDFRNLSKLLSTVHGLESISNQSPMTIKSAIYTNAHEKSTKCTNTDGTDGRTAMIKKLKDVIQAPDDILIDPFTQKTYFNKGVQDDTIYQHKVCDNQLTCVERYNQMKQLSKTRNKTEAIIQPKLKNSEGTKSNIFSLTKQQILRKIHPPRKVDTQGDRLLYIKANKPV